MLKNSSNDTARHAIPATGKLIDKSDVDEHWVTENGDHRHQFVSPSVEGDVARGRTNFEEMSPGIFLGNSDMAFLNDMTIQVTREPCLMISVLLQGDVHMRVGNRNLTSSAVKQVAVSFSKTMTTESDVKAGRLIQFAGVVAKKPWLEQNDLGDFLRENTAPEGSIVMDGAIAPEVDVPANLLRLANRLLRIGELKDPLPRLRREALVLEFFAEAMSNLPANTNGVSNAALSQQDWLRIQRVRDLLESAAFDESLSLELIAKEMGMSVSTLNRHFRIAFDSTVIAYLTDHRMAAAWDALAEDGQSVTQAAHVAGFSNATNFSTAFRRRYGMSPKVARKRIHKAR